MAKRIGMADIAREMGVSKTTVSRAFKDSNEISDKLKKEILEKAKEMNYQFNNAAKALKTGEIGNVGIIVSSLFFESGESFYSEIYKKCVMELKDKNYSALLEQADEDVLPEVLRKNKVDGLILLGQFKESYIDLIQEYNSNIVIIDSEYDKVDCVFTDNFNSSYKLTQNLIMQGHKSIGFVGNVNYSESVMQRFFGFTMGLEFNSLKLDPEHIILDRDINGEPIELVLPKKLPTALVCNNDKIAYEVINCLKERGIKVPEEVSVVGFDDTIYSELSSPKITTCEVQLSLFAKEGVRLLLERMNDGEKQVSNLSLTARYIEKESTCRITN